MEQRHTVDSRAFVLDIPEVPRERIDNFDVYRPTDSPGALRPLVVFVHGGPIPPGANLRDEPVFVGYGSLAATSGAIGITVEHRLYTAEAAVTAAGEVASAIDGARKLPGVDPERVAVWFFSGGGLISADWLNGPQPWLRSVVLNYPIAAPGDDWGVDPRFRPVEAIARTGELPVLLIRAGKEQPDFAAGVEKFVAAAEAHGANLEIIDVPNGRHAFDMLDHTDESRDAVTRAMNWTLKTVED